MANERVNRSPLSAREGKVYLDGILIADTCKFKVVFKPDVWSGKQLSEPGTNRRWIGYDIEVTIEEWKTTRRYRNMIDSYLKTGRTPELTIQGVHITNVPLYQLSQGSFALTRDIVHKQGKNVKFLLFHLGFKYKAGQKTKDQCS